MRTGLIWHGTCFNKRSSDRSSLPALNSTGRSLDVTSDTGSRHPPIYAQAFTSAQVQFPENLQKNLAQITCRTGLSASPCMFISSSSCMPRGQNTHPCGAFAEYRWRRLLRRFNRISSATSQRGRVKPCAGNRRSQRTSLGYVVAPVMLMALLLSTASG
jgi:hypothetical protein